MATSIEFIEYVCEQLGDIGTVTYKKMFGEYMVYLNAKPIFTVCDDTVYVKQVDSVKDLLLDSEKGEPYKGAKICHILDVDDSDLTRQVALAVEKVTPLPKPKKPKSK